MSDRISENNENYRKVYEDTLYFIDGMTSEYDFYPSILSMLHKGNMDFELKKKLSLKSIDEMWLNTIEETLPSLDTIIRNPSKFIEENEKVMNIEVSRNICDRSIKHLAQHTNYINKVEGDMITPSKILNVFHDETILTYENKFINTLIDRLFIFVAKRYDSIIKKSTDEKSTVLNFSGDFIHGDVRGKLHFGIEISEDLEISRKLSEEEIAIRNRITHIYEVVKTYTASPFVKSMGKNYIKPPVIRTNAILKNKDLRQCLALWEFISGCTDTGYTISEKETAETIGEDYIRELYSTCALQYLIFRYKINNDFVPENNLATVSTAEPFMPHFVTGFKPFDSDKYDIYGNISAKNSIDTKPERLSLEKMRSIAHDIDVAFSTDCMLEQLEILEREKALREEKLRAEREETQNMLFSATEENQGRRRQRLSRKKKKNIRRRAEIKAETENIILPRVFDYDVYERYLNNVKKEN